MRAAAYVRYSSDNQREESIDAQIRAIKEFAEREGITVVKIYADEARSATTDNRPEFQHMMADAPTGLFDCVIVHKLDRFSRDRYDSAFYKRLLKKNGVRLLSVLENLNDSPESIILESVLEGMAEYYSRNLAREVMKGMRETAYDCKHTGGLPPLGYDITSDKHYVMNPIEAETVKLIFTMYADGQGYSAIISALNQKGYKTKVGKTFGKNSLHEILKNEKYAGVFVFNKTQRKIAGKKNGHLLKNEDEIIRVPGGVPAIVSQATWSEVQSKMQKNKRQTGSYSAKAIYILSGHIVCGKCNSAMTGKQARQGRNKQLYGYYECFARKRTHTCDTKPINKGYIEKEVINSLYNNFFSPDVSDEVSTKLHESLSCHVKESEPYIRAAKKQLAQIQHEIDNVINAVAAGMFHPSMKQKLDDLEAQKATLEIRISEAELESKSTIFSIEQIKGYLSLFSTIREMSAKEQKKIVDLFVDQVIVYEDHADFNFGFYIERMDRKKKTTQVGGLNGSNLNLDGGGEGS